MRASRTRPQRRLATLIACAVALAVFVAPLSLPQAHAQDSLAAARDHYKRGNDLYASGDYQAAIAEFAAADNLSPSPTLEFNIALCYDRLGDRAEALRRYQLYLRALPQAANRSTVEAKIRRIQGEMRTESDERAAAAAAADAVAAAAAADAAAAAAAATPVPAPTPLPNPDYQDPANGGEPPAVYTPPAYQGGAADDPELARVAAINVASIRDQRMAGSYGRSGDEPGSETAGPVLEPDADADKGKESKPIYKQWWFWVVAGVSVIILIDFATSDSSSNNARLLLEPQSQSSAPAQGGLEWSF